MIEASNLDHYVFNDGKIISINYTYADKSVSAKLQIRKEINKRLVPCEVWLHFTEVTELNIIEDFGTSGNYSDIVLIMQPNDQVYASFDPFSNSGVADERDNIVIRAAGCKIEEIR